MHAKLESADDAVAQVKNAVAAPAPNAPLAERDGTITRVIMVDDEVDATDECNSGSGHCATCEASQASQRAAAHALTLLKQRYEDTKAQLSAMQETVRESCFTCHREVFIHF